MSDDDLKSCTLIPEEFDATLDTLDQRARDADLAAMAGRDWVPVPPSLSHLKSSDIYERFVVGGEPLPDLAAAEYIRRELQGLAVNWVRAERDARADAIIDVKAESVRHRDANLRAASIWVIAKGDLAKRGLVKRVTDVINSSERRAVHLGWAPVTTPFQRETRNKRIAQLIKDMRRSMEPAKLPFVLSVDDMREVEAFFAFDDLDVDAEEF